MIVKPVCTRRCRQDASRVMKVNLDTVGQYTFTQPIADHVLTNYGGALRINGDGARAEARSVLR